MFRGNQNHVTKGTVIGFDELNYHEFPGETLALKEVFGLDKYKIRRSPLNQHHISYLNNLAELNTEPMNVHKLESGKQLPTSTWLSDSNQSAMVLSNGLSDHEP